MSHDIDNTTGRDAFAYAGAKPWHGLGVAVPGLMTVQEALVAGGVDWDVVKRPLYAEDASGLPCIKIPDQVATIREDTGAVLGVVGKNYEVVQNRDALSFFDPALGEGAAAIETVGALAQGRKVFMMARMPEGLEIGAGDRVDPYLLFSTAHDGSAAVRVQFTPIRVVCANTLAVALGRDRSKNGISLRHTSGVKDRLAVASEVLGISKQYFEEVRAHFAALKAKTVNGEQVAKFLRDLFPAKKNKDGKFEVPTKTRNRRQAVARAFEESPGADMAGATAWGLFNAATWFIDHERSLPKDTDPWEASIDGSGVNLRQDAWDLAMALL